VGSYAAPLLQGTAVPVEAWAAAVGALLQRVCPLLCAMTVEDRIAREEKRAGAGAGGELPAPLPSLPKLLKAP